MFTPLKSFRVGRHSVSFLHTLVDSFSEEKMCSEFKSVLCLGIKKNKEENPEKKEGNHTINSRSST